MTIQTIRSGTVADVFLRLLADRGIDTFIANAGTDFGPIIEGFAKAKAEGTPAPRPITAPHENVGINMALGYYMMTGRPQAFMVHVNAGTANAICGLINASRGNLPVILMAGRTPYTETSGLHGQRSREVHWPQEMFDQGGMVREMVKWDYELHSGDMIETVIDRAINIAMSEPRGPVYLTLPREILAGSIADFTFSSPSRHRTPSPPYPDPAAVDEAADMIAKAENPLLITSNLGAVPEDMAGLADVAERFALRVTQRKPRALCLPMDHPMYLGGNPDAYLEKSDVILVMDCDVPWIPSVKAPRADCKIIHLGPDPLYARYPIRGYVSDLAITGLSGAILKYLSEALADREPGAKARIGARRRRIAEEKAAWEANRADTLERIKDQTPIHPAWISHCIDRVRGDDGTVVSEGPLAFGQMTFTKPGTFVTGGPGGGLGRGLGTALGVKLAAPRRFVICAQGDGAYMFNNPLPAHYMGKAENLPFLTVIFNNSMWGAVQRTTRGMYPQGYAARSNAEPLTFFEPDIRYERVVEAVGGHGERVTAPGDLPAAMERAAAIVRGEGRQAVLNVACS